MSDNNDSHRIRLPIDLTNVRYDEPFPSVRELLDNGGEPVEINMDIVMLPFDDEHGRCVDIIHRDGFEYRFYIDINEDDDEGSHTGKIIMKKIDT